MRGEWINVRGGKGGSREKQLHLHEDMQLKRVPFRNYKPLRRRDRMLTTLNDRARLIGYLGSCGGLGRRRGRGGGGGGGGNGCSGRRDFGLELGLTGFETTLAMRTTDARFGENVEWRLPGVE